MDAEIVKALESDGQLTTRELATRLGASRDAVYQRCKTLERDGLLTSQLMGAEKNVFFFPMTGEIVTRENHERIDLLDRTVVETVRAFSIPQERDQLIAALEVQFERLSESVPGPVKSVLEKFAEEVLGAVRGAQNRTDVLNHLGIRPMHPKVRLWALGGQLSLA